MDNETLHNIAKDYPPGAEVVALVDGELRTVEAVLFPSSGKVVLFLGKEESDEEG